MEIDEDLVDDFRLDGIRSFVAWLYQRGPDLFSLTEQRLIGLYLADGGSNWARPRPTEPYVSLDTEQTEAAHA